LVDSVEKEMDCTKLKLADGSVAPVFSPNVENKEERSRCINDYISFRPKDDIFASPAVAKAADFADLKGVGVISFLSLHDSIAGGSDEIGHWAERNGCNDKSYDDCTALLRSSLQKDVLWRIVQTQFRRMALDVNKFSFNTPVALPGNQGIVKHNIKLPSGLHRLKKGLEEKCSADPDIHFGFKGKNTCIKAYYAYLFVTSFFNYTDAFPGSDATHDKGQLISDPKRAWAEGFLQDSVHDSTASLWEVHTADYAEGFRIHAAAKIALQERDSALLVLAAMVGVAASMVAVIIKVTRRAPHPVLEPLL